MRSLVVVIIVFLIISVLIVAAIMHIQRILQEDSMTTEEWAVMMLTDYRDDVEAVVADMQARQEQGILETYVHKEGAAVKISLTGSTSYETENLTGNKLYERLIKKCISIELHENGVISFHRRGFLAGYTGFYYSPSGTEANIEVSADWHETYRLEGNYFCFEFGF